MSLHLAEFPPQHNTFSAQDIRIRIDNADYPQAAEMILDHWSFNQFPYPDQAHSICQTALDGHGVLVAINLAYLANQIERFEVGQ